MIYCATCGNKLEEHQSICLICYTLVETVDIPKEMAVIFQQEIVIPKRTKNTKKNVIIAVLLVMTLFGGMFLGFGLTYPSLEHERDNSEYNDLQDDYNDLLDDYNTLVSDFNDLFGQYQSILSVLEDPLTNPTLPTVSEIQTWLYYDDTDEHSYTSNWMCGDFAAMLMVRAKEMNWRMRIACMFWSYSGESGWENPADPYGSYGHAFNLIYCQDGNDPDNELDIFYIEPQSDAMWWINYGDNNHFTHYTIWNTFSSSDYSGRVWTETYYVNYYNYFA